MPPNVKAPEKRQTYREIRTQPFTSLSPESKRQRQNEQRTIGAQHSRYGCGQARQTTRFSKVLNLPSEKVARKNAQTENGRFQTTRGERGPVRIRNDEQGTDWNKPVPFALLRKVASA
jgi:hypothetical protein